MTGRSGVDRKINKLLEKVPPAYRAVIDMYTEKKPVPLGKIASELGIRVKVASLPTNQSGLIRKSGEDFEIVINRFESRERQRFTLAHEISHFLLHRREIEDSNGIVDNILYRSGQPANVEYEANSLASELIMPTELVLVDLEDYPELVDETDLVTLAEEWGVSSAALRIKLENLGRFAVTEDD